MYNLTYLGHRVTLPWLDLRSNFDLDLSRSNYTWFDAPWRDKHDGIKIVALPLKLKILSSKNHFGKFWNFDPWWPQFWPEPKNDRNDFEMIFRELSNAVFRFVLRCAGAEIDGGVQTPPPPPSRSWKIQRPSRARVKIGTWNFVTSPKHSLGILYQIFECLLCAEAPPGQLSRGHYQTFTPCSPTWNRLWFSETIKIRISMCDGLVYWETCPEIWPKSFKKQRSSNISKHLV